jgi:hypothetical protein
MTGTAILKPHYLRAVSPVFCQTGAKISSLATSVLNSKSIGTITSGVMKQVKDLAIVLTNTKDPAKAIEIGNQITKLMAKVKVRQSRDIRQALQGVTNSSNLKAALQNGGLAIGGYIGGRVLEYGSTEILKQCGLDKEKAEWYGKGTVFGVSGIGYAVAFGVGCTNPFIMIPLSSYVIGRGLDFVVSGVQYRVYYNYNEGYKTGIDHVRQELENIYKEGLEYGYLKDINIQSNTSEDEYKAFQNMGIEQGRTFFDKTISNTNLNTEQVNNNFNDLITSQFVIFAEKERDKLFNYQK